MEGGISPVALRNGVERSEVEEMGETGRKYQGFSVGVVGVGGASKGDIIDPEGRPSPQKSLLWSMLTIRWSLALTEQLYNGTVVVPVLQYSVLCFVNRIPPC